MKTNKIYFIIATCALLIELNKLHAQDTTSISNEAIKKYHIRYLENYAHLYSAEHKFSANLNRVDPAKSRIVSWYSDTTQNKTLVQFAEKVEGKTGNIKTIEGSHSKVYHVEYIPSDDSSTSTLSAFSHNVILYDLKPETEYSARAGDGTIWTDWENFETSSVDESYLPSSLPDRIILTFVTDPATSQAVTWRTKQEITSSAGEIIEVSNKHLYDTTAKSFTAQITSLETEESKANYHSVNFTGLKPKTKYAYRVGDGESLWSEWFYFKTASDKAEPFSFIYFGDNQFDIKSQVSKTVRQACLNNPQAKFKIYAGDLVNIGNSDIDWGEWFATGSFLNATIPTVPSIGNHDLGLHWPPQFALPEHGPPSLLETVYYFDFQNVRIISLNSTKLLYSPDQRKEQLEWLEGVLSNNPSKWTCVVFHHPIWGDEPYLLDDKGRPHPKKPLLMNELKPILDKYKVDLVMQGHYHYYTRGRKLKNNLTGKIYETPTMYVMSVSAPRYPFPAPAPRGTVEVDQGEEEWADRVGEDLELYQYITICNDTLNFKTYTATGDLYDSFEIIKQPAGKYNKLINKKPALSEHKRPLSLTASPEIKKIFTNKYSGKVGDRIWIHCVGDFRDTKVKVAVKNANNEIVEEGYAQRMFQNRNYWEYIAKTNIGAINGVTVEVKAYDRPGNAAELSKAIGSAGN